MIFLQGEHERMTSSAVLKVDRFIPLGDNLTTCQTCVAEHARTLRLLIEQRSRLDSPRLFHGTTPSGRLAIEKPTTFALPRSGLDVDWRSADRFRQVISRPTVSDW